MFFGDDFLLFIINIIDIINEIAEKYIDLNGIFGSKEYEN
jgi:hypothetical protein